MGTAGGQLASSWWLRVRVISSTSRRAEAEILKLCPRGAVW